jgi:hypothetical protein
MNDRSARKAIKSNRIADISARGLAFPDAQGVWVGRFFNCMEMPVLIQFPLGTFKNLLNWARTNDSLGQAKGWLEVD